jgi:hypothetical protein
MREHFQVRHIKDNVIIAEEGQLPCCTKCGIFQRNVGPGHQESQRCKEWTKRKTEREIDIINKEIVANTISQ